MSNADSRVAKGCLGTVARIILIRVLSIVIVFAVAGFCLILGFAVGAVGGAFLGITAAATSFFLFTFGGGIAFGVITYLRRRVLLDRAFTPLGLEGSAYRLMFRKYVGTVNGRRVEVYFQRGPNLEFLIQSGLKTRFAVSPAFSDTVALSRFFGEEPLPQHPGDDPGYRLWSDDERWARTAFADPVVKQRLGGLFDNRAFFVRSHVKIIPGYLQFNQFGNTNLFRWSLSPDQVKDWFSHCLALADHLERNIPAPAQMLALTSAEEFALKLKRKDTSKLTIGFAIGLILFFVVVSVVVAAAVAIMASLS